MNVQEALLPTERHTVIEAVQSFPRVFGEVVRTHRQTKGMTQGELAAAIQKCSVQVSQAYISLLEAGQRTDPSTQLLIALALVLEISLDEVLGRLRDGVEGDIA